MFFRRSSSFKLVRPSTTPNPGTAGVTGDAGLKFHRFDRVVPAAVPLSGIGDRLPRDPMVPKTRVISSANVTTTELMQHNTVMTIECEYK